MAAVPSRALFASCVRLYGRHTARSDLTRCTTLSDVEIQYWRLRMFPNLRKLSLKDCTFLTDQAILSLANAVPALEVLDFSFCCALLEVAVEVLFRGCLKLRKLDLSFCRSAVSDASLVAISVHLFHLQRLNVRDYVRVMRAGVDALLIGFSLVSYISISQCRNAHIYPGRTPAHSSGESCDQVCVHHGRQGP